MVHKDIWLKVPVPNANSADSNIYKISTDLLDDDWRPFAPVAFLDCMARNAIGCFSCFGFLPGLFWKELREETKAAEVVPGHIYRPFDFCFCLLLYIDALMASQEQAQPGWLETMSHPGLRMVPQPASRE